MADASTHLHETPTRRPLFADYAGRAGVFDETATAAGVLRPHVERFVTSLESLGPEELSARREAASRTLHDNDVTYNVYDDPRGMDRPWELDMIPLLIPPDSWQRLTSGLVQRAHLLNLILADLYGPQRLIHERLLPPALVFANPAFLRSCHGVHVPGGTYLHMHATDLARAPNGEWWALADRTQAPSGAGYALENRIVLARTLPEAFRDCQVERLASFFRAERDTLFRLAPAGQDDPKVVVLTPGPHNETYFEHAYLARYLGLTLVEGRDLTVRDRAVFIKSVEGLQRVDVILRRLDDSFCDPLELKGDSFLGVPGLVEAARAGRVAIANALGSGLVETSAILAFLPGLCRHLLGEDLELPSVATWWCGQATERQYVLDHLDELVIKRTFSGHGREPIFGAALSRAQAQALSDQIRARPIDFVGQEMVTLSTAPVWAGDRIEPRLMLVRMYAGATGDSYAVMPGGLTRVASAAATAVVSMQRGGGSKDTWVLTDAPVSPVTLLAPAGGPIAIERSTDLPSRVADDLFWLGRQTERAELMVRVLRAVAVRLVEAPSVTDAPELSALVRALEAMDLVPDEIAARAILPEIEREILAVILKDERPVNLPRALRDVRSLARRVRDRLSVDTWRILTQLQEDLRARQSRAQPAGALLLLNRLVVTLSAFSGMEMENMTRGHGWRFLEIGRRLERAVGLVGLIRAAMPADSDGQAALLPLMEIADSAMTYRRRYFTHARLAPVLDLLLCDDANPRSLAFQVHALSDHIDRLPRDARAPSPSREQQAATRLSAAVSTADMPALCQARIDGRPEPLEDFFDAVTNEARALSDTLTHYYFSHAVPRVS